MQAISAVEKIPNTMPVIIYHATQDPQLDIDDARAMYYKLREQGNENAYLIEINYDHYDILNNNHFNLLDSRKLNEINAIKAILNPNTPSNLEKYKKKYQPDYLPLKAKYDALVRADTIIKGISIGLKVAVFSGAVLATNMVYPWLSSLLINKN